MSTTITLLVATGVLAAGTYAFRVAGPLLHGRVELPAFLDKLMSTATVVMLAALVATAALLDGSEFAGVARPAGVAVAGVLAWRKAPFVVIVIAAAATAALLRLLGVP